MKLNKNWIEKFNPCFEGVKWLEAQEERDGIKVVEKLIKEKKFEWANWTIVTIMTRKQYLAYAIYAAEQVIDIFEKNYPNDKRPRNAIKATKKVLKSDTEKNRAAARAAARAARAASAAASAASDALWAAVWAASDAASAARAAASAAARAASDAAMQEKILEYGLKLLLAKR